MQASWGRLAGPERTNWPRVIGLALIASGLLLSASMFLPGIDPFLRAAGATASGFLIGGGLQLAPSLFIRRAGPPQPRKAWLYIATSAVLATGFGVLTWLRLWTDDWAPAGFLLLGLAVCALGAGLGHLYPGPDKHPAVFLLPVGFNGLLLFEAGLHSTAGDSLPVTVMVFVPALVVSIVLTIWAFRIRGATAAEYAKATEVARGALWGWLLLLIASVFSSAVGIQLDGKDSLDPLRLLLPVVTFGSVIAAVTSGFSRYAEVHASLETLVALPPADFSRPLRQ